MTALLIFYLQKFVNTSTAEGLQLVKLADTIHAVMDKLNVTMGQYGKLLLLL